MFLLLEFIVFFLKLFGYISKMLKERKNKRSLVPFYSPNQINRAVRSGVSEIVSLPELLCI